jgi:hypothetical protein
MNILKVKTTILLNSVFFCKIDPLSQLKYNTPVNLQSWAKFVINSSIKLYINLNRL